jgi:4-hydroxybenzoate polyprenyltransferase
MRLDASELAPTAREAGAAAGLRTGPAVADRQHSWVDRLPRTLRDLAILARWDRPIGTWLLLLPCWWGLALAPGAPDLYAGLLFAIGAMAMRGAGCTVNDLADREFDRRVERTRHRPLAAGRISPRTAVLFIAAQCLVGLVVLLQLPPVAIAIGFASVPLIVIYPFMKRITWWPQAFLGITFNWGILVGYATATGGLDAAALLLYLGGIFWTLGYDTIYAHQDKEDDVLVGVHSTARLLGARTRPWLVGFYAALLVLLAAAAWLAGKSLLTFLLLPLVVASLALQIRRLDTDDPKSCLAQFRANRGTGLLVTAALALGSLRF